MTVTQPDEAIRRAAQFVPHAAYLGIEQVNGDGWDLAARLRNVPGLRDVILVGLVDRDAA